MTLRIVLGVVFVAAVAADGPYSMSHHNPAETDLTVVDGPTKGNNLTESDAKFVPVVWCSAPIVKKVGPRAGSSA